MSEVIDLSAKRAPVCYTVHITHLWDGKLEVWVEDVQDDPRSRAAVGDALKRAAEMFNEPVS